MRTAISQSHVWDSAKLGQANRLFNDAITHKTTTTVADLSQIIEADIRASRVFEGSINAKKA